MKLAINVGLSLAMLALCVWLVWPSPEQQVDIKRAFEELEWSSFWPYLAGYVSLLAVTHFFRAWRWNNLLHPIGVWLSPARLLTISSVGFMAILALPARLGEFVRPALIRERGKVSAAAALGTIAVERIVDGLVVSIFVFAVFFTLATADVRGSLSVETYTTIRITAYIALAAFVTATAFLAFALRWPRPTIRAILAASLVRRFAPRMATTLEDKLHSLISGFRVLSDVKNLSIFLLWTVAYWVANALGVLVLARGFGLDLSLLGALFATGMTAVGISLPNAPALIGQFQFFMMLGVAPFVGEAAADTQGLLFAVACHGIQVIWYIGCGMLSLASRHVSFSEVVASRKVADDIGDEP